MLHQKVMYYQLLQILYQEKKPYQRSQLELLLTICQKSCTEKKIQDLKLSNIWSISLVLHYQNLKWDSFRMGLSSRLKEVHLNYHLL